MFATLKVIDRITVDKHETVGVCGIHDKRADGIGDLRLGHEMTHPGYRPPQYMGEAVEAVAYDCPAR